MSEEFAEIVKLDKDKDVGKAPTEVLWYDDSVIRYRYWKIKTSGQKYDGWSAEDFVNLHVRIVQELKRRKAPVFGRDDDLDKDSARFLKGYAIVRPSGVKLGDEIRLEEVLPHLLSFKLRQPYVYLVGGLVIHGKTQGDIDVLIKDSPDLPPEFRHIVEWRLLRALPPNLWNRVQFHYDRYHGPFTDNIPLYDLTFERVNPANRIFRMSLNLEKAEEPRAGTPEVARQAAASAKEDKIKPMRFFVPMKPVRGYRPEQRQTLDHFLSLFKEPDFPVHSTKKYDGANYEIHKVGEKVEMWSEDGEDNTTRFPGIVDAVKALPWKTLVLLAEVEKWDGKKHLPREAVAAYVRQKDEPDDSAFVANVYDVVYAEEGPEGAPSPGDAHKMPFKERERFLRALGIKQGTLGVPRPEERLNRAPSIASRTIEELREDTNELARQPGSEGNVAKKAGGIYAIAARTQDQIKFHNSAVLAGVVTEAIETKVSGVFNYRYAIAPGHERPAEAAEVLFGGKPYVGVGKTFSTAQKAKPGDIIEVEFETLNLIRDVKGNVTVTAWAPRVMKVLEDRKEPDTVGEAVEAAKRGRVFQEKRVSETGETVYLSDVEKANYMGNKQRLATRIVDRFPKDAKRVFDPMAGCGAVLFEAARRGLTVIANDVSVLPYWYCKGILEGAELSEADSKRLVQAPGFDGWLTKVWKGKYPRSRSVRRYADGVAKLAREWSGKKGLAARAVASRAFQTYYQNSGSGHGWIRFEDDPKRVVENACRSVNKLIGELSGKGHVTNEDARSMRFPSTDVVYFDPPYIRKNKARVDYGDSYRIPNSALLGKDWKTERLTPEHLREILRRLCKSGRSILLSTSTDETVPYLQDLKGLKRQITRSRLAYEHSGRAYDVDREQRQYLYEAKSLEKQADPYMRLPAEGPTYRYVCQEHWRGKGVHADFRIESVEKKDLIGWTLSTQIPGVIDEPVTTMRQAREAEAKTYSKINWDTGEWAQRKKPGTTKTVNVEIVSHRKALEPHAWLEVEGVTEVGAVGGTKQFPGVFVIVDKGGCEYGSQKPWLHEYFPQSSGRTGGFRYRVFLRQLRVAEVQRNATSPDLIARYLVLDPGIEREDWDAAFLAWAEKELVLPAAETEFRSEAAWFLIKPIDQTPYVLSSRAVKAGWVPPKGHSALPRKIREEVPPPFRYWQQEKESERREMRDALVKAMKADEVELPIEKAITSDEVPGKKPEQAAPEPTDAIYLVPPHSKWIAKGSKKMMVKSRRFDVGGKPYLLAGDLVYGVVVFGDARKITLEEFEELRPKHRVSDEERKKWWPEAKTLWAYDVVSVAPFAKPRKYKFPKGAQTLIRDVEYEKAFEKQQTVERGKFVLQYQYFRKRGEKPVRAGPTRWHWDLRIDVGEPSLRHWRLDADITKTDETVGYFDRERDKRRMMAEGFYPPGSPLNPTKDTPSFIEIVDSGKCRYLVDQPSVAKIMFDGKKLKGLWLLEKKNSNWHVHRTQAAPKTG